MWNFNPVITGGYVWGGDFWTLDFVQGFTLQFGVCVNGFLETFLAAH